MTEENVLLFDCHGAQLVGVLSLPPGNSELGVVLVVGGPQYRIGSHRQFTLLGRSLAIASYPCLRFDHRGIGDSDGGERMFDELDEDIRAAMDALQAALPGVRRIVLWGLCDAASAILLYHARTRDPRIAGMVLLNPWVRSEETLATVRVRSYYGQRFRSSDFWRKLLSGGINPLESLREYLRSLGTMTRRHVQPQGFQDRMLEGIASFRGGVRIILSGEDLTAKEFEALCARDSRWQTVRNASNVDGATISGADHTFSRQEWRDAIVRLTIDFLKVKGAE